jgi:hypothetical protein
MSKENIIQITVTIRPKNDEYPWAPGVLRGHAPHLLHRAADAMALGVGEDHAIFTVSNPYVKAEVLVD